MSHTFDELILLLSIPSECQWSYNIAYLYYLYQHFS